MLFAFFPLALAGIVIDILNDVKNKSKKEVVSLNTSPSSGWVFFCTKERTTNYIRSDLNALGERIQQ